MKTPEQSIATANASLSAKGNETSPRVLGFKMGCTFAKGVAPQRSVRRVCRQKDDVEDIDFTKTSQPKNGNMPTLQLEKVNDIISRELSEDLSGKQEIEVEKSKEPPMKLKSTSDDEASLSYHELENTQNTSGDTATSSVQEKISSTCKSGTMKSSSSSSQESEDSNSANGESEDNSDGNESIPGDDYVDDNEDDDEDNEHLSVRSQSPEKSVDEETDDTSKIDILKKKVKSPKSIASRIKDYNKKIGDQGVKYSILGPSPDYDMIAQPPKSDMKGFLSPQAKQAGFIPVAWNKGMMKSTKAVFHPEIPEGDEQNISTDHPSTTTDDLSLMDPSHFHALPENIFSVSNPPVTSTPKTPKDTIPAKSKPCTATTSDVKKQLKPRNDGEANGSSTDAYDETTNEKTQEMYGGDETNKPLRKAQ